MSIFRELWVEKYRPTKISDFIFDNPSHEKSFKSFIADQSIPHLLLSGVQGSGKAQPLDCKVLTPDGWRLMGDLEVGDKVTTPTGDFVDVLGIFDQGLLDSYEVEFHDGAKTRCNSEHLWKCTYPSTKGKKPIEHISTLSDMMLAVNKKCSVSIPIIENVDIENTVTPSLNPYLLGVILGDGGTTQGTTIISSADDQILESVRSILRAISPDLILNKKSKYDYNVVDTGVINLGGPRGNTENKLTAILRKLNIFGKSSLDKFLPTECFQYSLEDKWELVRGLMDTDGTIPNRSKNSSSVTFSTSSKQLAVDLQDIMRSIGCTSTMTNKKPFYTYKGTRKIGNDSFVLHICHNNGGSQFFNLDRKKQLGSKKYNENHIHGHVPLRRKIKKITKLENQEEMRCIFIDSSDHLYITDDYIVTHNTTIANILIDAIGIDPSDVLYINASDENSVDVMRDKIKSFVMSYAMGHLGIKIVLLEEADFITLNGQAVLRRLMEDYVEDARFILTANHENKIMPAIKSRCQHFSFNASDTDDIAEYVAKILIKEKIEFDTENFSDIDMYIRANFPDIRKIVNNIQQNSTNGKLADLTETVNSEDYNITLLQHIAKDDWVKARDVVCSNISNDEIENVFTFLYRNLDKSGKFANSDNWDEGIIEIAQHLYMHALVADPEINLAALFIKLKQI